MRKVRTMDVGRAAIWLPLVLFSLAVPLPGCRGERDSFGPRRDHRVVAGQLTRLIEHEMREGALPALSVALVDDQEVVWAAGFGLADPEEEVAATAGTVYRVGSVSKLFTDIALMQLVERGDVDLDLPVTMYLPDFKPRNPFGKPITLRQLMCHRSGLVREPPVGHYFDPTEPTLAETIESLNSTELVYPPESRTKYSNAGVSVVGRVVEKIRGKPFAESVEETVLRDLKMAGSSFRATEDIRRRLARAVMGTPHGRDFPAPVFELGTSSAGNLFSSVLDLSRFLSVLCAGGRTADGRVLKEETLEEMWKPQYVGPDEKTGFGLGFSVSEFAGHRRVGHGGAVYGFATELGLLTEEKLGVVVVASRDVANPAVRRIAGYALRSMLAIKRGEEIQPPELSARAQTRERNLVPSSASAQTPSPVPARWEGLIGEYGWDHNTLYILENRGQLHALIEWFFLYRLDEITPDVYAFPDTGLYHGEKLVFERGADGVAMRVEAAEVIFERRPVGSLEGEVFRVKPVRPVVELRKIALAAQPPEEKGKIQNPHLVNLSTLDSTIKFDIRYATTENFLGTVFYSLPRAFLQEAAAGALLEAHRALKDKGYGLLIHDAYRPWYVTKMFWDATPEEMKGFVADPSRGSRHNRGAAVDLTLYELATGQPVNMVSGYDEFSDRSFPLYPGGTTLQRWHRDLLRRTMEEAGFTVYRMEWWHFDFQGWERYPILNLPFEEIPGRN